MCGRGGGVCPGSRPVSRRQEIEEDRKKAEQEGIAVTALRRARPPDTEPERRWVDKDLSVTVQVMLPPGVSGGRGGGVGVQGTTPGVWGEPGGVCCEPR